MSNRKVAEDVGESQVDELDRFMEDGDEEEVAEASAGDGTGAVDDPLDEWMSGEATSGEEIENARPAEEDPLDEWMLGEAIDRDVPRRDELAHETDPLDEWMSDAADTDVRDMGPRRQEQSAPDDDPLEAWMSGDIAVRQAMPVSDMSDERVPAGESRFAASNSEVDEFEDYEPESSRPIGDVAEADGFEDYEPEASHPIDAVTETDGFEDYEPESSRPIGDVAEADGFEDYEPSISGDQLSVYPTSTDAAASSPMPTTPTVSISLEQPSDRPYGMISVLIGCVGLAVAMIAVPRAVAIALAVLAAVGIGFGIAGIRTQDRVMAVVGILMGIVLVAWRIVTLVAIA